MKKLLLLLFCIPICLFGQGETPSANLYVVVNMTVDNANADAFEAAVKAHNEKFHAAAPYAAELYYNINGPNGGSYTWIMGPTSYTAMDTRPGEGAHDDDWDNNVTKHVESMSPPGYWSGDAKLSIMVADAKYSKRMIWLYDIKRGQGARWSELVGKVAKVYKEKRPDESFIVGRNDFANTKEGNDAVIIFPFDKWAWMDRQSKFSADFEAVHGAGSWHNFLNEFAATVDGRVDWVRTQID